MRTGNRKGAFFKYFQAPRFATRLGLVGTMQLGPVWQLAIYNLPRVFSKMRLLGRGKS